MNNNPSEWTPGGYGQSLNRMHRLSGKKIHVRMVRPNNWFGWLADWVLGRKPIETQIEEILVRKASAQQKRIGELPFRHLYHPCKIGGELHFCIAYGFDVQCRFRASEFDSGSAVPYWEVGQILGGN